eukprot:169335_1
MFVMSVRRIIKEMREWKEQPLDNICVDYIDESDLFTWKAIMIDPKVLHIIKLSNNYPIHGMCVKFKTKIYTCNVSDCGFISTDLFGDNWTTKCNIKQVLQIIYNKCFYEAGDYDYNCVLRTDLENRMIIIYHDYSIDNDEKIHK